jgi:hypothetical protein
MVARTYKRSCDLSDVRTLQKLEIERVYWRLKGIDWAIMTEKEINPIVIGNVAFVKPFYDLTPFHEPAKGVFQHIADYITMTFNDDPELKMREYCAQIDRNINVDKYVSFIVARHLIARWVIAMDVTNAVLLGDRRLKEFRMNN